jgi:hypothetical protein
MCRHPNFALLAGLALLLSSTSRKNISSCLASYLESSLPSSYTADAPATHWAFTFPHSHQADDRMHQLHRRHLLIHSSIRCRYRRCRIWVRPPTWGTVELAAVPSLAMSVDAETPMRNPLISEIPRHLEAIIKRCGELRLRDELSDSGVFSPSWQYSSLEWPFSSKSTS